ncbi:MAG: helix-hairpin-helix domain-containing protein [Planctomycetota bacterium]
MPPDPEPSPAFRWLAAGFLGGAATIGLIWSIVTRTDTTPLALDAAPTVLTLAPLASPEPPFEAKSEPTPAPPSAAPIDPVDVASTSGFVGEALGPPATVAEAPSSAAPVEATTPTQTPAQKTVPEPSAPSQSARIRINTATAAELDLLPGIGPALAARIVRSRQLDGPFHDPSELKRVHGVGEKTAERIAPYLRFD